jgi:hypothetical protein
MDLFAVRHIVFCPAVPLSKAKKRLGFILPFTQLWKGFGDGLLFRPNVARNVMQASASQRRIVRVRSRRRQMADGIAMKRRRDLREAVRHAHIGGSS